ncbi:hypothetical protein MAM1_0165d07024 [Mucor ambiguus]|uniref:Uncharacterized protein n=1 Tax=Mucor ambiguus TaxID=91626 RepID=A0A0C9LVX3_9FUNG|nr:hypothetical protein MAM1_0165d07024 [Mucor ambiguus]
MRPCWNPLTVHNVFNAFFEQKSKASTIQPTVAIKVLGHVNMPFNIATNDFFENENEGDAVESRVVDNNSGTANAAEAKALNGHAEQETADDVA